MPVAQIVIDLLNAPVSVLREVATQHEIEGITTKRKWDLAVAVAQLPREVLEVEIGEYLYAGSTAISWIRLISNTETVDHEDPDAYSALLGLDLSREDLVEAFAGLSDGDPLSEQARPDSIDSSPKLVVAREREDGYMLTFAVARSVGHVIHNFEHTEVFEDDFFNAVLRPEKGSVEVRASASRARRLQNTWLTVFADSFGAVPVPVAITHGDYNRLHKELGGRLDTYRGKTTSGATVFDTHEFTKADNVTDLLVEEEFQTETVDLEPVSFDLLFAAEDFGDVRIHVSVINGSIFVRTAVPERILRYIYEVLERIKGE